MTARRAYSLDVMLAEIHAHAPHRSTVSDGWIGDAAHASRASDHNPNAAGVVRAQDVTDDPDGGMDGSELAQLVAHRLGKIPALKSGAYVIHNARIISFDRLSEGWRPYTGTNAHRHHVHISVATSSAGYDSRQPWNLWSEPPTKPRPALEPIAWTRVRNAWNDRRELDLDSLELLIDRGQQPYATKAKIARDAITAAMKGLLR